MKLLLLQNNRQTMRVFTFKFFFCYFFLLPSNICTIQIMSSCLNCVCTAHIHIRVQHTHTTMIATTITTTVRWERKLLLTILHFNFVFHDFFCACVLVCTCSWISFYCSVKCSMNRTISYYHESLQFSIHKYTFFFSCTHMF